MDPAPRQPIGICLPHRRTAASDAVEIAVLAEELGFASVWVSEVATYDAVAVSAAIAERTTEITIGISIVPATTRTAALHAMSLSTLGWLLPGRCVVGYGVSTPTVIDDWHGQCLDRPLTEMRELFDILDQLTDGGPSNYSRTRRSSHGFRLEAPAPNPPRRWIGALGPKMRAFCTERAEGILLNLSSRRVLPEIAVRRPREGFAIAMPIRVAIDPDPEDERRFRREAASYPRVPAYAAAARAEGNGAVVDLVHSLTKLEEMSAAIPAGSTASHDARSPPRRRRRKCDSSTRPRRR
jgi:alkanesulfonate monooxygenase SsuD/methylene tetrahydromethanopterin reductase-like flavin-dependent oxidoreductase (luciferase family)